MKRPYILFGALLVVLILAFSFTKSYLSSLEESSRSKKASSSDRKTIDSLKMEIESQLQEYSHKIDRRLDSLEQAYRLSDSSGLSRGDSLASNSGGERVELSPWGGEEKSTEPDGKIGPREYMPTEEEVAIYDLYLKKRWALPADLTRYELKVAKAEIYNALANQYKLAPGEIAEIVDRVYEFERKGKKK